MNRGCIGRSLVLLLGVLLGHNALDAAPPAQPSLVVFLSDDHGLLDSTPYGATDVRTPNMQRLAAEGMLLTRAFIASPACAPSRTAMLTGLMPARNGAEANHTFKREGIGSLPENLVSLGYEVAAFGKVAHGNDVARHGFTHHDQRYDTRAVEQYPRNPRCGEAAVPVRRHARSRMCRGRRTTATSRRS